MASIARLLKKARAEANVSQQSLAVLAGTSQSTIAAYESGRAQPRIGTFERLVDKLGFDLELVLRPRIHAGSRAIDLVAGDIKGSLLIGLERQAWHVLRRFMADCRASSAPGAAILMRNPPASCGYGRFDAAIAATVELVCADMGLGNPAWTEDSWRFTAPPWNASRNLVDDVEAKRQSPVCFIRHGVLATADLLGRRAERGA